MSSDIRKGSPLIFPLSSSKNTFRAHQAWICLCSNEILLRKCLSPLKRQFLWHLPKYIRHVHHNKLANFAGVLSMYHQRRASSFSTLFPLEYSTTILFYHIVLSILIMPSPSSIIFQYDFLGRGNILLVSARWAIFPKCETLVLRRSFGCGDGGSGQVVPYAGWTVWCHSAKVRS